MRGTVKHDRTFLEFFAGIGLMRLGLEKAGWQCRFANDNNSQKAEIYESNFGVNSIEKSDIEKLTAKDIPSATLATASFPCQDLSEAGPHLGIHGPRSAVFWHFVRILDEMRDSRPPLILIENVRGFLTGENGGNLITAVKALNDLGYACDVALVDAKYFVPQSRPRVFVTGILDSDIKDISFRQSDGFGREHLFRPLKMLRYISRSPRLKWLMPELPPVAQSSVALTKVLDPPSKVPRKYWFSKKEINRHLEMMPEEHRNKGKNMNGKKQKSAFTMYRRIRGGEQRAELRFDGVAGCLRTATGGSSKQFVVIIDKGKIRIRRLTIPEMARLMGVPEGYNLPDNYLASYRALGDAVVVPVVEWVARNMVEPLYDRIS